VSEPPLVGVSAVVVDHDRLLLVRRGRPPALGRWAPPGGRVEHGETLVEAVTRELREETGLEGVCGPFLGWTEHIDGEAHIVIMAFEATLVGDDVPVAGDDAAEATWVELHDVAEMDLVDGVVELLYDQGIIATFT
jgi:8-oxo-dGTP diphosphatase